VPSTDSKIICTTCNREVQVTDVQNGINFDEYYLSCGHIQSIDKQDVSNNKDNKFFNIDSKRWYKILLMRTMLLHVIFVA
jgi:hypothetical protein